MRKQNYFTAALLLATTITMVYPQSIALAAEIMPSNGYDMEAEQGVPRYALAACSCAKPPSCGAAATAAGLMGIKNLHDAERYYEYIEATK